jgi:hypothetical protein
MSPMIKVRFPLLLIASSLLISGCYTFYKADRGLHTNASQRNQTLDSLKQQNRYFILHSGSRSWHMKNMVLSDDQKTLSCILDSVSYIHQLHLARGYKGNMRYKKGNPEHIEVLNEVHVYIPSESGIASGSYNFSLDKVQKIEVIEKDKRRTTNSYVLGAIGYTVGTLAVAGIIAVALKSSCPFVSAYDGHEFSLQGEIYGGSIHPQLARHDFMPLRMAPLPNGSLQIKISNELKEHQYTDMADLWVITHDRNKRILVDQQGKLYSIAEPQMPLTATLNSSKNVLRGLEKAGDNRMVYLDDSSQLNARNEVVLAFNKNDTVSNGKFLLTLKNSYFLDLLYGELAKGFGSYYMTYIKEQRTKPAAELLKWVHEQQIPLTIALKTKEGWKKIESITTIGPLATREMVVSVDLSEVGDGPIEIKLSSGFMFWEIDYAAIDYTSGNDYALRKVSPRKATDEKGRSVLSQLRSEDGKYLEQPNIGNVATIIYKPELRRSPNEVNTYILHTKGYYEHIRDFQTKPDLVFLSQFKKPDAFAVFGMRLYQQISAESLRSLGRQN